MNSRWVSALATLSVLGAASFPLGQWAEPICAEWCRNEPVVELNASVMAVEQAVLTAVLGGFRAAAADFTWLRAAEAVEERDAVTTETMLEWVAMLDSRSLYFWLNGARILAYDVPGWQASNDVARGCSADAAERAARRQAALRALRWLDKAMTFHPESAALWIERANVELNGLGDVDAAAASYRRAWEQPHAPFFAARLHAELLRRSGHKTAALDWLIQLHPRLPPGDEAAAADLVLARIRQLEKELGVPFDQAYRPLTPTRRRSFLHPC